MGETNKENLRNTKSDGVKPYVSGVLAFWRNTKSDTEVSKKRRIWRRIWAKKGDTEATG